MSAEPHVVACPNPPCFLAGDFRVNEQTALTVMHTVWVREHNRIAQQLRSSNPRMSRDEIFQTTRNIVAAQIQKITYKDYLPLLLGDRSLQLIPNYAGYNENVNPNIPNAFATAAYRYGHSQIQPFFERLDENLNSIPAGPLALVDAFFDTSQFTNNGGTDPILRGLLTRNARQVDEFLNGILTNRLFAPSASTPGLDLAALNVQRGRDHGLPRYLTWKQWARETCGVESDFRNSLTQIHLLQTYGSLNNVDLFVGGLAEAPLKGGRLGAVFACIFANTFRAVRDGDRFYYENAEGNPPLFTAAQRQQIERTSLSRVICDNTDISEIQPNAFLANQARRRCSQLPSLDLSAWSTGSSQELCYLRYNTGNGATSTYNSISRRVGQKPIRFSKHRMRRMMNGCLSFLCPQEGVNTRMIAFAANRCPVMQNANLKRTDSSSNRRYSQFITTDDIRDQNGLYTSLDSCMAGSSLALTFCRGDEEVQSSSHSTTGVFQQQQQDDVETVISEDELRQLLPSGVDAGDILGSLGNSGGNTASDKSSELIALIERVLETLREKDDADEQYFIPPPRAKKPASGDSSERVDETKDQYYRPPPPPPPPPPSPAPPKKPWRSFQEDGTMDDGNAQAESQEYKDSDIKELENALRHLN